MSNFTQGKWDWKLTPDDRAAITVNGEELHPTLADVKLICAAPEMYELLYEVADELRAIGLPTLSNECYELLSRIDGESKANS